MTFAKNIKRLEGPLRKKRGQGIVHVSNLFQKYLSVLKAPQGVVTTTFIEIVEDHFSYTVRKDQCAYNTQTQTLTLHVPGMLKTEILLKKKLILTEMRDRLGVKSAPKEIL